MTKQTSLLLTFFLFVHFALLCSVVLFFFFWTIGVVMADSVENILHVWSPLLWTTSLPTKPGMGRQNDFERSHNASHIWCPWASRCVTVLNHSVWLRAESWELHAHMILSRHPCLLPQLWPPVARTRAGLWQNGTGLSSITSQLLDGNPLGLATRAFFPYFFLSPPLCRKRCLVGHTTAVIFNFPLRCDLPGHLRTISAKS